MDMNQLLAYASGAYLSAVPACRICIRKVSKEKTKPSTGFEQVNLWLILGVLPPTKKKNRTPALEHRVSPLVLPGIEFRDRDQGIPDHTRDLIK